MQLLEVAAKGILYGDTRILAALCILQPLDLEPSAPGLQPSCVVSLVRDRHTANELETVVPPCDPLREARPCWHLEPHPACEAQGPGSELRFEVDAGATWPEGLYVRASCEVE